MLRVGRAAFPVISPLFRVGSLLLRVARPPCRGRHPLFRRVALMFPVGSAPLRRRYALVQHASAPFPVGRPPFRMSSAMLCGIHPAVQTVSATFHLVSLALSLARATFLLASGSVQAGVAAL